MPSLRIILVFSLLKVISRFDIYLFIKDSMTSFRIIQIQYVLFHLLSLILIFKGHLNKPKTPSPTSVPIPHHNSISHMAEPRKVLLKIMLSSLKLYTPYKKFNFILSARLLERCNRAISKWACLSRGVYHTERRHVTPQHTREHSHLHQIGIHVLGCQCCLSQIEALTSLRQGTHGQQRSLLGEQRIYLGEKWVDSSACTLG